MIAEFSNTNKIFFNQLNGIKNKNVKRFYSTKFESYRIAQFILYLTFTTGCGANLLIHTFLLDFHLHVLPQHSIRVHDSCTHCTCVYKNVLRACGQENIDYVLYAIQAIKHNISFEKICL